MAKRRDRQVVNPLNMDAVAAIGTPPEARPSTRDAVPEPASKPVQEPKPQPATRAEHQSGSSVASTPHRPHRARSRPALSDQELARQAAERVLRKPRESAKDSHQLKTRFTPQEAEEIEAFRRALESRLGGVKVRNAQITRALWTLALGAEEELDNVRAPELSRPSYGDSFGMAAFEDEIARFLLAAIKRARRQSG